MTERIQALRERVLAERAAGARACYRWPLVHQSLRRTGAEPRAVRHAKAQAHILDNAPLALLPGELLVGSLLSFYPEDPSAPDYAPLRRAAERIYSALAASDGAVPSMPRAALTQRAHADSRIAFRDLQRLARELALAHLHGPRPAPGALTDAVAGAYRADYGPARRAALALPWTAASRFAPDFQTALNLGFRGLDLLAQRGLRQARTPEKIEFFLAQRIALSAAQRFILRYANATAGEANRTGGTRGAELSGMSAALRKLGSERADTFYEGVQLILLILVMAQMLGGESVAIGRLDQLLGARYDEDLRSGDITEADARELLTCLFVKLNEPGWAGTCAITLGGATPGGADGSNALTRICLEALADAALPHPAVSVRVGADSPDWLLGAAGACAANGRGQPSVLCDAIWIDRLARGGCPLSDARNYIAIGDGLIGIPAKSAGLLESPPIALPALVSRVLARKLDGELALETFDQFMEAYRAELAREASAIWLDARERAADMDREACDPFASMLVRGPAGSGPGRTWIAPLVGLATATDALCAIKKWAYDKGAVRLDALAEAARDGFADREHLVRLLRLAPRYGCGIAEADDMARAVLQAASEAVAAMGPSDGWFTAALADGALHAALGERMGATCDGRRAAEPLSGGADPHPGRDVGGLDAMLESAAALDAPALAGGFALNVALRPDALSADGAAEALMRRCVALSPASFRLCAQDAGALLDARDRAGAGPTGCTGGLCEWFAELDASLQDEIIRRTVHEP